MQFPILDKNMLSNHENTYLHKITWFDAAVSFPSPSEDANELARISDIQVGYQSFKSYDNHEPTAPSSGEEEHEAQTVKQSTSPPIIERKKRLQAPEEDPEEGTITSTYKCTKLHATRCSPRLLLSKDIKYRTIRVPFVTAHQNMSDMLTRHIPEQAFVTIRDYIMNIQP